MRKPVLALLALALGAATAGCGIFGGSDEEPGDLQVYSARHYDLEEAFAEFEEETGLKVDFLFAEDAELLKRLEAEGEDSPADLFVTVDAGNLWAADAGRRARADRQPDARRRGARGVPRRRRRLVRPRAPRPHRRLQPRQRRPRPSSTPRTPTPGSATRSGRAGCACATAPRPTPSAWSPR